MAITPIAKGTLNWDAPLNTILSQLDTNTSNVLASSLQAANNLSDLTNVPQARSNLGLTAMAAIVNNLTATAAPTTSNDGTQGYTTGSLWLNTTTSIWYRCVSNGTGAAVWTQYVDASSAQTITGNKTFTGSITSTSANIVTFNGTTTGQQVIAVYGADTTTAAYNAQVTGDTFRRWVVGADGLTAWGPGATGRDVFAGRAAASTLYIQPNLLVGSSTSLGDNGVGELQLANVTTAPTTNPTGGVDVYSQAGIAKIRNPQGLVITSSGIISLITSSTTITTTGLQTLASTTIPANDPVANAAYEVTLYGVYTTNATATTLQFTLYWGTTAGTVMCATPSFTVPASQSGSSFTMKAHMTFRSTTSAVGMISATLGNGTGAAQTEIGASSAALTVTTTAATPLTIACNFNNAQSITLTGGDFRRLS